MRDPNDHPRRTVDPSQRWRPLALAIAVIVLIAIAFACDALVWGWVRDNQSPAAVALARTISRFSAWPWLMLGAVICLTLAWFGRRRSGLRILIAMMLASSVAGLGADFLRGVTGRTRPYATGAGIAQQGWYGVRSDSKWLVGKHAFNAFPSGHTAAAVAMGAALFLPRRRLGAVLLCGAAIVGASRIYLGAHHFSDVVAGAVLGSFVAVWAHRRLMPWLLRRTVSGELLER